MTVQGPSRTGQPEGRVPESVPLLGLLVVLTITTGLIDAVSMLGLGRVFTANMTGNVVFLGFALAAAPGFSADRSLVSLAGGGNPRWVRRLMSVAAMLGGAALGAALVLREGLAVPLAVPAAITLASTIAYVALSASREERREPPRVELPRA